MITPKRRRLLRDACSICSAADSRLRCEAKAALLADVFPSNTSGRAAFYRCPPNGEGSVRGFAVDGIGDSARRSVSANPLQVGKVDTKGLVAKIKFEAPLGGFLTDICSTSSRYRAHACSRGAGGRA